MEWNKPLQVFLPQIAEHRLAERHRFDRNSPVPPDQQLVHHNVAFRNQCLHLSMRHLLRQPQLY